MKTFSGQAVHLADYQPAAFTIDNVHLDIRLDPEETVVISTLKLQRSGASAEKPPLVLDGDDLKLDFVSIDGQDLRLTDYKATPDHLTIPNVPDGPFELQITTRVNPTANTQLMGLYRSSETYCTQCEAEGFRRITYFLDRPDVLSKYTTRIEAQRRHTTYLLSNGNLTDEGVIAGTDRHFAVWEDPHPKPSYLFALVAGHLAEISDTFTTMSGREVALKIYVERGKEDLCDWAMESLKKCMRWDEEVFGREYDLDIFMIVAVSDFNMGAMENKGLNIFNDKYVLADTATATDDDFVNIEAIIAHEYFHNWTGNRITCRDWFQLCLKEGLTVFRDQEFTSDLRSRGVKRIQDVRMLRGRQFPEDAGPLAHPVRPNVYHEINNFYTATVYEKGAELVRMMKTIAGAEGFKRGLDLYFERHDGEAAIVEDFLSSISEGADVDLTQFSQWYEQAGTPHVAVSDKFDPVAETFTLEFSQTTLPTPGQQTKLALHIPIKFGLVGSNGEDLNFESVSGAEVTGDVIHLKEAAHTVVFSGIKERPVPSLLREFSAPVRLVSGQSEDDLIHLIANDKDSFSRWQAMQTIAQRVLIEKVNCLEKDADMDDRFDCFFDGVEKTVGDETLDAAYRAQFLSFPSEGDIAQAIGKNVNPQTVFEALKWMTSELALRANDTLITVFEKHQLREPYSPEGDQVGARRLKNAALAILCTGKPENHRFAQQQYQEASNLTDRLAALHALLKGGADFAADALSDFDKRYRTKPLVMDKWFAAQAINPGGDTLKTVKDLMKHPSFSITNPNRIRSLIGAFASGNQSQFHRQDGAGYQFISNFVVDLDAANPQVAARLLTAFSTWRLLEPHRRERAQRALRRVSNTAGLSSDVRDIVTRTLAE